MLHTHTDTSKLELSSPTVNHWVAEIQCLVLLLFIHKKIKKFYPHLVMSIHVYHHQSSNLKAFAKKKFFLEVLASILLSERAGTQSVLLPHYSQYEGFISCRLF